MPVTPDGFPLTVLDDGVHNAFPGLSRDGNGDLILVYRKGTTHASSDGAIYGMRSADNGDSWGAEFLIYDNARDVRDPSITLLDDGTLIVSFFLYTTVGEAGEVYVIRSTDDGDTWDTPVEVASSFGTYAYCSAPVVELADGTLVLPCYGATNPATTNYEAFSMVSTDGGDTWGGQAEIAADAVESYAEPYVTLLDDGTLHCLVRSSDGKTYRSLSTDDGATWSTPVFSIDSHGRPSHVVTPSAMLYVGRPFPFGDPVWRESPDNGETWTAAAQLHVSTADNMTYAAFAEIDATHWLCVYGVEDPDPTYFHGDLHSQMFTVPVAPGEGGEIPTPTPPSKAILEIYVHDEDASRWGTATWATGAATGTEGIWSGAGWQDVTPQGVTAHIIWGSREPDKGILARQNAASWNVETYDPDRILDPGNADSPYYPQIVAGTPIRISHDTTIIRTGLIDRIGYKYKAPDCRGQLLCTDTISLLNQAKVPEDSILGDILITRVQDAIEAAGVAVGGIPLPPSGAGFTYPAIAPLDTDNPRERSVWDHIVAACEEVLFVPFIGNTAGLGLRNWGFPLDRGREITAANLEDLESVSHEDGLYSVVRVQGDDPLVAPIEREAAPLPRYGRRVYERTELTVDPEGFADAVLQERSWPGVRYSPGTIHCWTAEDVDYFGSLQIMERVTVTVPGAVSVEGRILGGELWVQHYRDDERGATWQFNFAVATEGSTAIGLTTLVSSQSGEALLDSQTGSNYLEASQG